MELSASFGSFGRFAAGDLRVWAVVLVVMANALDMAFHAEIG